MASKHVPLIVSFAALILTSLAITTERSISSAPLQLQVLTRDGCVNSPRMLQNVREAVHRVGSEVSLAVIDQGTLSDRDARRGYATPTVLVDGIDAFGATTPVAPFPAPS